MSDAIISTIENFSKSVLWFHKKRWKCEIPIGSNVKLSRVMSKF
jgi:hypothetical protein